MMYGHKSKLGALACALALGACGGDRGVAPALNGITQPVGYKEWKLIAVSHRTDKDSLRAILGNAQALRALHAGETAPWPDGAILAKLVWKASIHDRWPAAIVPGELQHVEFMIKDAERYAATGGWGYARWLGMEQKPYGSDAGFAGECFDCHKAVQDRDYVFTRLAPLP
jgi:hypothetical protein